jgi:hypothetical protein
MSTLSPKLREILNQWHTGQAPEVEKSFETVATPVPSLWDSTLFYFCYPALRAGLSCVAASRLEK